MAKPRRRREDIDVGGMRQCRRCDQWLPLDSYGLRSRDTYAGGRLIYCTPCSNWRQKISRYGLSQEELELLMAKQGDACAICRRALDWSSACVDHDHDCCPGMRSCGACVRGLLCSRCNSAIGFFNDNPAALRAAAAYLEL
jgi:Recombination endonuclease VII